MSAHRRLEHGYAARFDELRSEFAAHDAPWLARLRADAIARARAQALPSPRVEEWKFTNLRGFAAMDFAPAHEPAEADEAALAALALADTPVHRLVFVNGRFDAARSDPSALPAGATLAPLARALTGGAEWLEGHLGRIAPLNGDPFVALNTAFLRDGCVLRLAPGTVLERPVQVISLARAGARPIAFHPRLLVVLERDSEATLIESHGGEGAGAYWSNPLAEIELGPGARLVHTKLQDETMEGYHVALTRVRLGAQSRYENFALSTGAALSRNQIEVAFDGTGGQVRLLGGYLMRGRQHADTTIRIDHARPGCTSREIYKGVLDDAAHGVFQGKIVVHAGAQKTDGHQLSRTLLLSDRAAIDTKPELEIFADDVKCSHGATVGELDDEALFYLRSRGLDEARARRLLIEAFVGEIVGEVALEGLRQRLRARVAAWLGAGAPA